MIFSRIVLKNWRNFQDVDVRLSDRAFLVGPNASGKSNFLDVFRFLKDIAEPRGGGLQTALLKRGGVSKLRCLAARRSPDIEVQVDIEDPSKTRPNWRYSIGIYQETSGSRRNLLRHEKVWRDNILILNRPDSTDKTDIERLTETHLEQTHANAKFRELSQFLESVQYLHLVPQLVRNPDAFRGTGIVGDPYGQNFLEVVAGTPEPTRRSRLKKIERALKIAVPKLKDLHEVKDATGFPHIEARYDHWRGTKAKQRESEFSDGTLRMIGLFWTLLDGIAPLLLEEPELSLNAGIVRRIPELMHRVQQDRKQRRQVILSTHSRDLLMSESIASDEVLILIPPQQTNRLEATTIRSAASIAEITELLDSGMPMGEAVMPHAEPDRIAQMELF